MGDTNQTDDLETMFRGQGRSYKKADFEAARERRDPCMKERQMSLKCQTDHAGEQWHCKDYFTNVKNCIKFWDKVSIDRRKRGIEPAIPIPSERDRVKAEYMEQWNIKSRAQ